jgi:hypothetical protein
MQHFSIPFGAIAFRHPVSGDLEAFASLPLPVFLILLSVKSPNLDLDSVLNSISDHFVCTSDSSQRFSDGFINLSVHTTTNDARKLLPLIDILVRS